MSKPLTLDGNFNEIALKQSVPIVLAVLFLVSILLLIFFGTSANNNIYIYISILGVLPLLYLMIKYPRIWIYSIALTNIYFFYDRGDEVSLIEIILAIQYLGTLSIWMFWMLLIKREKLVDNIADIFIFFFLLIILGNSIINYINSNDMMIWVREAFNLLLLCIYFPIKKYFTEKKELMTLLVIYSIVVTASAFLHFNTYLKVLQGNIQYAYELSQGIRVNQSLFTAGAVFGFIFALHTKNKILSLILVVFTSVSIAGLVTSFSRTYWIILIIEMLIVVFYLSGRQRIKLMAFAFITSLVILVSLLYIFEDKSKIMVQLLERRLTSAGKGTSDISIQARFAEYEQEFKGIMEYPMAGQGLSKKITYWNTLESYTSRVQYIHNGYIYVAYKMGIPAFFVFFFPFIYYLVKGEKLARKESDVFFRILTLGSYLAILMILISIFTATQLSSREGNFVIALSFSFISIAMNRAKNTEMHDG